MVRRTRASGILLAVLFLVTGCTPTSQPGSTTAPASTPKSGGTLVVARPADSVSLDSSFAVAANEVWVYNNIYEQLVTIDENGKIGPGLAERWERLNDLTMRFYLRKGVKFQDDTPFDAKAVAFNIDRLVGREPSRFKQYMGFINGAKVVDDSTVDITSSEPYGPVLGSLSHAIAYMTSPAAVEKWGKDYGRHPVGTGPFTFVEWKPNDSITLERNNNYWGAKPYLDKIVFKVIPEEGARTIAFDRGDIDVLLRPAPTELKRFGQDSSVKLFDKLAGTRVIYVGLNVESGPTSDVRVRQAMAHAVDVRQINEFVLENAAFPATNFIAPAIWGYKDEKLNEKYPYSLEKSASLMQAAGYTKGQDGMYQKDGKTVEFVYWHTKGNDLKDAEISQALQAQLVKAGFKVTLTQHDPTTYLSSLNTGATKYQMFTGGWGVQTGDADGGLYFTLHSSAVAPKGSNWARYANPAVDALLDKARRSTDDKVRSDAYAQAQDILANDVPWIPINVIKVLVVTKAYVNGFTPHPNENLLRLGSVWTSK